MRYDPLRSRNGSSPYLRRDSYHAEKVTPLAPISEVRRVTFAARYVADKENHNLYTPVDVVGVRFIPSISEYDSAEKQDTWYSNEETKAMKQTATREASKLRELIRSHTYRTSKHYHYLRGLEKLVYCDNNLCARIRHDLLCAVLEEQYRQRCKIYGVHNPGGIVHPYDDCVNEEKIRQVAILKGETIMNLEIARELAKHDMWEANEYLERRRSVFEEETEDDRYRDDVSDTSNQSWGSRHHAQTQQRNPQEIQARQLCWGVSVMNVVRQSPLLHAMLTPFLQVPKGDALLV